MADISIYVVSAVFLVLIGSVPCRSEQCTQKTIKDCHMLMNFNNGFCKGFTTVVECLKKIKPECSDDSLIQQLTATIEHRLAYGSKCPGMTANCFFEAKLECIKQVPIVVKRNKFTEQEKKKHCQMFKGKEQKAKQCLEELKTQCNSLHVNLNVASHIKDIEDIEKICASYN